MNKIKNFRLALNTYLIQKQLKSRAGVDLSAHPEAFAGICAVIEKSLEPSAIFETVSRDCIVHKQPELWRNCSDAIARSGRDDVAVPDILAVSFIAVSLGAGVDEAIAAQAGDDLNAAIASGIAAAALDAAGDFVGRLINEEAQAQNCLIHGKFELPPAEWAPALAEWLDPQKIEIIIKGSQITPRYTNMYFIPWMKKKRKK